MYDHICCSPTRQTLLYTGWYDNGIGKRQVKRVQSAPQGAFASITPTTTAHASQTPTSTTQDGGRAAAERLKSVAV